MYEDIFLFVDPDRDRFFIRWRWSSDCSIYQGTKSEVLEEDDEAEGDAVREAEEVWTWSEGSGVQRRGTSQKNIGGMVGAPAGESEENRRMGINSFILLHGAAVTIALNCRAYRCKCN
jgi:hypothetical protein